jgi:putative peptidoglycan lipid II flippase
LLSRGNRNHALYVCQIAANSLVGYLFARMLAYQFGTSAQKDGFDIAYSVPFIVLNLSGLAYIHSVVMTQYSRMLARKSPDINSVFSVVLTWMTSAAIVLLIVATFFSDSLTSLLAPGLSPAVQAETQRLLLLMLPLALTLGIGTFFGAILAAHEVPVTGEFCQIISRVVVIGFIVCSGFQFDLTSTAVGLVFASGVGLAIQWWILHRNTNIRFHIRYFSRQPEFLTILKQGSGFLACAIAAQVAMAYMRRLAVLDGVGTIAALSYALAVVTPLSLFIGKPLALRIGPRYADFAANERWNDARQILVKSAVACLLVSLPVCLLTSRFAVPLVRLLFGGGQFDAQSISVTASLCAYIVWALPASLLLWVIVMPTLSTRNSSLPGAILTVGHFTHIALSALLFGPFGKFGIAAAYVAAVNLQALYGTGFLIFEWQRASRKSQPAENSSIATALLAN